MNKAKTVTWQINDKDNFGIFFTLIVPIVKAQEIHPELGCLCSFPENKIRHPCVLDFIGSRSHISSYEPEQTWWVSDPSAWGCPPRLHTCTWVTGAGTAGGWRCGWTCVPSWSPQAGSLTTSLYQAEENKKKTKKTETLVLFVYLCFSTVLLSELKNKSIVDTVDSSK